MRFCALFLVLFAVLELSSGLSCKDERNRNVDWFIIYKLPKISSESSSSSLFKGKAYAYIDSRNPAQWQLSPREISSESSILGLTWKELKQKREKATYLFYNDDTPDGFSGSTVGHLKGYLAFDTRSGFWLTHSIPNFGKLTKYEYPESALTNGQHAICVTFKTSQLNDIVKQLIYAHPNIYLKNLENSVKSKLNEEARALFSEKPSFIRSSPFKRQTYLESAGNQIFISFAKDNQLPEDLFGGVIAPELKTGLYTETWRRGVGRNLPATCRAEYDIIDIIAINMTAISRGRPKSLYFKSTEDHSKWAISISPKKSWVCLSDMNRMESQEKRGGGALCFQSNDVWKAFKSIIAETDTCPI